MWCGWLTDPGLIFLTLQQMCVHVGVPRAEGSVAKHVTLEVGLVSRMTGDKQVS